MPRNESFSALLLFPGFCDWALRFDLMISDLDCFFIKLRIVKLCVSSSVVNVLRSDQKIRSLGSEQDLLKSFNRGVI